MTTFSALPNQGTPETTTTVPRVVVIIVNWNGLADTRERLESLARVGYANLAVVVVDNGSRDDQAGSCAGLSPVWPFWKRRAQGKLLQQRSPVPAI